MNQDQEVITCMSKKKFWHHAMAKSFADALARKKMFKRQHAYKCRVCGFWHLTTARKKTQKAKAAA